MIGLKRGIIKLCDYEKEWEKEAQDTIIRLKNVLGDVAKDIQHVGSTSIPMIKAKPIIDIAVAVDDFKDILALEQELKSAGFYYRPKYDELGEQLLFASGSYYQGTGDLQTHFIHVVHAGGMDWINYINFRDYLNHEPSVAKEYERLKLTLASQAPVDSGRKKYTSGKHDFIVRTLRKALVKSFLGKTVNIKIDRPMGSRHPRHPEMIYPVNYGFIPNVYSGDGAELDVYLLGVDVPVREYTASVIGIIYREDDVEDKLVAAPNGIRFSKEEIQTAVNFQEQFFKHTIEVLSDI
ncbi:MAG: GrpB family protein [Ruminococcus sp.]|nr:GrpB family protein [Ruminococcus sp.]